MAARYIKKYVLNIKLFTICLPGFTSVEYNINICNRAVQLRWRSVGDDSIISLLF